MNQTVTQTDRPPGCFGLEWDRNEPECAGGPHLTRKNERNGTNILDRCDWYQSCGSKRAASNMSNFIPVQNLIRPPLVTPPPQPQVPQAPAQTSPQTFGQWAASQMQAQAASHQFRAPQPMPPPQYAPQQQAPIPIPGAIYPATSYQLNYTMPGYLSTPEERGPGESVWAPLGRELVRALFKAIGHTTAHFFDKRPLR